MHILLQTHTQHATTRHHNSTQAHTHTHTHTHARTPPSGAATAARHAPGRAQMQAPLGAVAGMRTLPRLVLSTSAAAALLAPHLLRQRNSASEGRGAARGHPSKGAAAAAAASLAPAAVASPAPAHGGPLASAARLTTTLRPLVLLLHSVSTLVLGRFLSLGIVSTLASWVSDRVVQVCIVCIGLACAVHTANGATDRSRRRRPVSPTDADAVC
jgi:hypothetical protein